MINSFIRTFSYNFQGTRTRTRTRGDECASWQKDDNWCQVKHNAVWEFSMSDLLANISLIIHHSCLILRQQDSLESIKIYQHGWNFSKTLNLLVSVLKQPTK